MTTAPSARTLSISRSRRRTARIEDYLYFDNVKGLLACVQMGTIEFHGWGSKVAKVEYPDRLVFDLDPDVGLDFAKVKDAAVRLRGLLEDLGLESFPLLTGGKGVHVVVPLDASKDWPRSRASPSASAAPSPRPSRRRSPPTSARPSARAASSSTGSATSAARQRSCHIPRALAKARRWRPRSRGTSSTSTRAGTIFPSATRTSCWTARLEDACGLGQGEASLAGCISLVRRFLPLLFLLTAAAPPELARWKAEAARVTIVRDDWGIAHVHGPTDADAVFGMIYAQAEDDFPRIEANYLTALGRTAEAEGEKAIWQDLRARLYVGEASSRTIMRTARRRCRS